jgi:hypothetical protein
LIVLGVIALLCIAGFTMLKDVSETKRACPKCIEVKQNC